ncbi:hypothetical protein [uncultured Ilyobacter sp.]|uniref:hypothetical protein n=1 Tax=uncultured Ilyobacter sp. TaxID=544433 RepID=UPI0029C749F1|nr:hypothetical protein [uncultured Ilyobacter sp.]
MEKILDFLSGNAALLWPLAVFLVGWILPVPKFLALGRKAAETIPPSLAKLIAERLKAFERGLLNSDVDGDINLVDNETVKNELKKVKLDLGLKE